MAWTNYLARIDGRPAYILVDGRFREDRTSRAKLPRLAWFGVYAQRDPGTAFWHPDETDNLDAIESDLIRLCELFGHGWAVYVLRIDTRGVREYFIYFGGTAQLAAVPPSLQAAHPGYRIEYEETADPLWNRYVSCLQSS
jgi:hypothetical protein